LTIILSLQAMTLHIFSPTNFAMPTMIRYFSKTETAIDNVVIQSTIKDYVQAALIARFDSKLFQKKKQQEPHACFAGLTDNA
jgi:hypothetical protein